MWFCGDWTTNPFWYQIVRHSPYPLKILFLAMTLATAGLLSSCAHHDDDKPQHRSERKWWQGDMDTEERAFFLDSFVNH